MRNLFPLFFSAVETNSKKVSLICQQQKHPFHILDASPFPVLVGLFTFFGLVPQVFYLHGLPFPIIPRADLIHMSFIGLFFTVMVGFISIIKESSEGYHTTKVQHGLRMGMLLFIVSEVMLFFSFFGAFFHVSLIPSINIGGIGPPVGTQVLDVWGLPFVNTLLLLTSGVTITIAHAYIIKNNHDGFSGYLFLTILLGTTFLICQGYEYKYGVKFSGRENIYGSIFFITTGFHGMHVTVGTMFLAFCGTRNFLTAVLPTQLKEGRSEFIVSIARTFFNYDPQIAGRGGFTPTHHFGFEAAAGYGHFVDVVGLFLFITVYGGGGRI